MRFFCIVAVIFFDIVLSAQSAVLPEDVLIIANRQNAYSQELAEYYAHQRSIPSSNILVINVPDKEIVSRQIYDREIAYPIRSFLQQRKLENKIRVLTTVFGVPLKIGPAHPNRRQLQLAKIIRQKYFYAFNELEKNYHQLEQLAGILTTQPTTLPARNTIGRFLRNLPGLYRKIQYLYKKAISHIKSISDPMEKQMQLEKFVRLRFIFEGRVFVLQNPKNRTKDMLTQLRSLEQQYWKMASENPLKRDNRQFYELTRQYGGIILLLKTLYEDYQRLMDQDSASAVDSELSLVLWKDYPLAGRVPNALNPRLSQHPFVMGKGPVLMTCRLDAPSPKIVRRMIDDSIKAEKSGLNGRVYIDARGLKKRRGFDVYDNDLRALADLLRSKTSLDVVLDNKPTLFAPGSCPNAALYCGWYSLRRYIPAFTFVRGAIGYHIASFEAQSLHRKQNNTLWCPKMLQAGASATLGPVDEPFLDAFPLPSEFFGLLLTGKYNMVEVFYKTLRYNSWRIILIADPLYNPFAKNPQLDESEIKFHKLSLLLIR